MSSETMQQLSDVGGNLLQPYSELILKLFTNMQAKIDYLQQRIEVLENGGNETTSSSKKAAAASITIPKSDKKATKSAPVTPTAPNKSSRTTTKRKKKSENNNKRASTNSITNKKQKETQILKEVSEDQKEDDNTEDIPSEDQVLDTSNIITPATKERGTKKPLRYVFQNDHNIIKQSNNGAGAIKPKFKPGTVRFGKYVSKEENNGDYASYVYKFDTASMGPTPSGYAFGVCNKGFSDYTTSNFGNNGCVMIKGNGQFITTDGVFTSDNKEYVHKQILPDFKDGGVFGEGDIVCMEIDVENLELWIWNETRDNDKVFKVKLPNKPLAPIVYMGGSAKRKIMISEQCAYKYKEQE